MSDLIKAAVIMLVFLPVVIAADSLLNERARKRERRRTKRATR